MNKDTAQIFENMKPGTMIKLVSSKGRKKARSYFSPIYLNGAGSQIFHTCMDDAKEWYYCGSGKYNDKTLIKLIETEPSIPFMLNGIEGANFAIKEANNIVREVYQYFDAQILRNIKIEDINKLLNVNPIPEKSYHVYGRHDELLRDGTRAKPGTSVKNTAYSYSYRKARCRTEVMDVVFTNMNYMIASTSEHALPQAVRYCFGEVTRDNRVDLQKMLFDSNGYIPKGPYRTRLRAVAYIIPEKFGNMKLRGGRYMLIPNTR